MFTAGTQWVGRCRGGRLPGRHHAAAGGVARTTQAGQTVVGFAVNVIKLGAGGQAVRVAIAVPVAVGLPGVFAAVAVAVPMKDVVLVVIVVAVQMAMTAAAAHPRP